MVGAEDFSGAAEPIPSSEGTNDRMQPMNINVRILKGVAIAIATGGSGCGAADDPSPAGGATSPTSETAGADTDDLPGLSTGGDSQSEGPRGSSTGTGPDGSSGTPPSEDGSSSSSGEASPSPDGVAMFVALGQGARTVISCDDGETWVGERAVVDDNDDHGPFSSRSLASGDGVFVAGVGWGNPGRVRRSADGVTWEQTLPDPDGEPLSSGIVGVAFGGGLFMAVERRRTFWSEDLGLTWEERGEIPATSNLRVAGASRFEEGRFYVAGDGGQVFYTADDGATWQAPSDIQESGCENANLTRRGGIADGDGVLVIATDVGLACRSDDGGSTFTIHALAQGAASNPVWTGSGFYVAGGGQGMWSPDGVDWTASALQPADAEIRRVAVNPDSGVYVAVARDGDRFYRSLDGIEWTQLPEGDFTPGNDLTQLVFGYGSPSEACPG